MGSYRNWGTVSFTNQEDIWSFADWEVSPQNPMHLVGLSNAALSFMPKISDSNDN